MIGMSKPQTLLDAAQDMANYAATTLPVPAKHFAIYKGKDYKYVGTVSVRPEKSLDEQFLDFHAAHPEVYETLVKLARQALSRGLEKVGIRMLYEVARWEFIKKRQPIKLNDHFHSRYSRMIMGAETDLRDVFETRRLKT